MADGPKLTLIGKLTAGLFIAACFGGAYYMITGKKSLPRVTPTASVGGGIFSSKPDVEIGLAYGTEKQRWLEWAVNEFAKTPDGKRIKVKLIPLGSIEGAHAILSGDQRIHAWSPASTTYKDVFVQDWQTKNSSS